MKEKIREGMGEKLEDIFSELDHWGCSEECGHKVCLVEWRDELIGELLSYLHSQGVVIKVDRELPEKYAIADLGGGLGMDSTPLFDRDGIKEAGYGAFELLVKDV